MGKFIDLTGQRFGRLVVIERAVNILSVSRSKTAWHCKCECGGKIITISESLKNGSTQSCGCLHIEHTISLKKSHGLCKNGNGGQHRLYNIWISMRQRCFNKNSGDYKNYGGRGITICKAWDEYENFYTWAMANGYQDGLTIERKHNNGNYEPDNCTWIPKADQINNTRRSRLISFRGETKTMKQWSDELPISYTKLKSRLKYGWDIESALTTP
jgi:hypothetical protein